MDPRRGWFFVFKNHHKAAAESVRCICEVVCVEVSSQCWNRRVTKYPCNHFWIYYYTPWCSLFSESFLLTFLLNNIVELCRACVFTTIWFCIISLLSPHVIKGKSKFIGSDLFGGSSPLINIYFHNKKMLCMCVPPLWILELIIKFKRVFAIGKKSQNIGVLSL